MSDPHAPDLDRLGDWIRAAVTPFKGNVTAHKFGVGQSNPTYRIDAGAERFVLRRKPPGKLLSSAHAVEREFRVISALAGTGIPVPKAYALCEDPDVIGSTFYLMEFVEGRHFPDPALPDVAPAVRASLYNAMNETIARLHQVDYAAIGLGDYGKPGNFFARQIDRWGRQYRASVVEPIPALERMIETLPQFIPDTDESSIVHGDFRTDNMIFHATEPRIAALLDWELSTIGHPLADFSYHMIIWRLKRSEYRFGIGDLDFATYGIPDEASHRAAYCRRTGRAGAPEWEFCVAYNLFRLAAVLQGIAARAEAGNASSPFAAQAGSRARSIAEIGWRQTQRLLKSN